MNLRTVMDTQYFMIIGLLRNSHYDLEESDNITDQDSHPTYVNATALNEDEVRSPLGDEYNVINRGNFKARVRDLTGIYSHLGQREKKRSTIIHDAYLLPMVLVLAGFLVLFFIVFCRKYCSSLF